MRALSRRSAATAAALLALLALPACKDATSVPDLNNLSSTTIQNGLTPASVQLLTTGLLNADRANFGFRAIVFAETMARDVYNIDPAESRFITELLGVPIDPGGFTGGGQWAGFFNAVRTGTTILQGIAAVPDSEISAAGKSAEKGLVRTIDALQLLRALELRGTNGIPVVLADLDADPAPIRCYASALAAISAQLDTAYADLQAGGAAFPVPMPEGFHFNGRFDTPATFAKVNRAFKGKVEVYRGIAGRAQSFTDAITALDASFLDVTADTKLGPYYTFSTAPNEITFPLAAATIYLNPAVGDSIQAGDLRKAKIGTVARVSRNGVATTYQSPMTAATNLTSSLPMIRNAELILLRAQAEIGLGQLAAATRDVNVVRTKEGGLAPYATFASSAAAIDALLYEKRYSLLLEGPQRLVDLRVYGRVNAANLKKELTTDGFNSQLPIPKVESDLRNGNLTCQQ
jgi:hypothetical protein